MTTRRTALSGIAAELDAELRAAFPTRQPLPSDSSVLRTAFSAFGRSSAEAGSPLDETLSIAVEALQDLFQRSSGSGTDHSHMRAAGIALAATSRAHGSAEAESASPIYSSEPVPTQVRRLSALHQINRAATANLKLSEMLETVVDLVCHTTESDACEVFLYEDATGLLTLRAAVGLNLSSINAVTIRIGSGITGQAALQSRLISAPDASQHEHFLSHPAIGDEVYTSQVSVPILLDGQNQLVGVLNIHTIDRRDPDPGELEFLQTVAGELAFSIENARRYSSTDERLRQKVSQLGTLQRVSRMLASTLELPDVLRLISEQAIELINAEAAAIFRFNNAGWRRNPRGAPIIEHRVGSIRELLDPDERDNLVRDVIQRGAAQSVNTRYQDGMATLFCLPLRTAREPVGALCFRLTHDQIPDEDAMGLLQAFSDSAAMAIENAQLYQDAMHSVQTQSALVQEMHHRVRNNLQTVAALLSLQLRTASEAPWATEIREAISRIQSIAAVHDLLSDEQRLGGTTVDVIARLVAEDAHSTLIPQGLRVNFQIEPSTLRIPTRQATIISLLINELAANAISHGFEHRDSGDIRIRGWEENGFAHIEVYNDGRGVPDGFDPAQSSGLGMRITQRLVTSDLKGAFTISSDALGTTALIRFPIVEGDEFDV
jgi:two-component sensor histidine kinase/putative methionine-R-sulfoxide reductase with GAF domain